MEADTDLEASRAPIDELDSALRLERCDSQVDILWHDISAIQETGSHVLSVARIALNHLVVGLEAVVGNLLDRIGLVRGVLGTNDRSVSNKREMNTRVWDKVGLELVEINVEGTVKT